MLCDDIGEVLAATADGSVSLDDAARRHVEQCLRCQAELVQYRKLLRTLRTLRTEVLEPAPGLLAEILAQRRGGGRAPRRPVAPERPPGRLPGRPRRSHRGRRAAPRSCSPPAPGRPVSPLLVDRHTLAC